MFVIALGGGALQPLRAQARRETLLNRLHRIGVVLAAVAILLQKLVSIFSSGWPRLKAGTIVWSSKEFMMSLPPAVRLVTPIDEDGPRRIARLRELGIREEPDPEFDEFARTLAQDLNAPFAMVNIIGTEQQYMAGLYPSSLDRDVDPETDPFRAFGCDVGYCVYVLKRQHAMALDEVLDYHLFAGNPAVEAIGVRAYLGAPLIDETVPLGTVCVVDTEPHDWGIEGVEFIKARAAELVRRIRQRAGLPIDAGDVPDADSA